MDRRTLYAIAAVVVLAALFAIYEFLQSSPPAPAIAQVKVTPQPRAATASAPTASQVIESPQTQPPLPQLANSDDFVLTALADVLENPALMKIFNTDQLIHNIVATVDNLPQQSVTIKTPPFNPPTGRFLTSGTEGHLSISPGNANRYTAYVTLAVYADARKLVQLYVHLYPLFQQAYEELGYPNDSFNDQLNDTLDDLLNTPDIKDPIKLVQPKFFYVYADPDVEALSIGQKIMLRLGRKNIVIVKGKLNEIKQELALHVNQLQTGKAN